MGRSDLVHVGQGVYMNQYGPIHLLCVVNI